MNTFTDILTQDVVLNYEFPLTPAIDATGKIVVGLMKCELGSTAHRKVKLLINVYYLFKIIFRGQTYLSAFVYCLVIALDLQLRPFLVGWIRT